MSTITSSPIPRVERQKSRIAKCCSSEPIATRAMKMTIPKSLLDIAVPDTIHVNSNANVSLKSPHRGGVGPHRGSPVWQHKESWLRVSSL